MENRIWTKLTARVGIEDLDCACAVMGLLDNGLMIEDYSDFALDGMYGELADESILEADRTHASVSLFVPAERPLPEYVAFLRERFAALGAFPQECVGDRGIKCGGSKSANLQQNGLLIGGQRII